MSDIATPQLFPELKEYVEKTSLLDNAKGILAARLPRILGQGKTRAEGLDLPPATIERQQEFLALSLPEDATKDPAIRDEIESVKRRSKHTQTRCGIQRTDGALPCKYSASSKV